MKRVVDNRGLPCPQPVINTRRALMEGEGPVVCIVDNEAARENVARFARSQGYHVDVVQEAGTWRLTITRAPDEPPGDDAVPPAGGPPLRAARPGGGGGEPAVVGPREQAARTTEAGPHAEVAAGQVILVGTDRLGRGSDELGGVLMRSFLYTLTQLPSPPDTLIFVNSGVYLTTEGSPVLEELTQLQDKGTEILSCGTCLEYFQLKERLAVGRVTNMYEIAEKLLSPGRVLSL